MDLIGYLQLEKHTVPLLEGLGYLEAFYNLIEKIDELELTKDLGVRRGQPLPCMLANDIFLMPLHVFFF